MSSSVQLISGPLASEVTRESADRGLKQHPAIRKGAAYALEQVEGHWVAAIVHESGPFPPGGGDETEAGPPPEADAGGDPAAEGPPSPDDGGGEGPPSGDEGGEKKEKGDKKGEGGEIKEVLDALHQIADALGVPLSTGDDSMVPGPDDGAGPPGLGGPPEGPPGAGGPPPGGPPGGAPPAEKPVKPGEALGAPAFSSVRADHPFAHLAGKVASFRTSKVIGDTPMETVAREITALANEIGYQATVREGRDNDGNRVATAVITAH